MLPVLLAVACSTGPKHEDSAPMPPPVENVKPAIGPKVYLDTPRGEVAVSVEVVATEAKIERGLMYRQHLPPDDGMLFLMDKVKDWSFWMHNTLIPLDIIFVTPEMTVAGVAASAEPQTDSLRKVGVPSLYVLEVNGGYCASHGVAAGAKVRFEGVPLSTRNSRP